MSFLGRLFRPVALLADHVLSLNKILIRPQIAAHLNKQTRGLLQGKRFICFT
jgi:hypothetical protein